MATAEQNTLLALQLFGAPAQQFAQQNDARTSLLFKIAMQQREEQLRRDLMAEQDQRAYKLADYQQAREDRRNTAILDRQENQLRAAQTRENTQIADAQKRQSE